MCGIGGIYRKQGGMKGEGEKYYRRLEEMKFSQKHRGPDEEGVYLSDHCGLAHVRLSILDLKNGRQPMEYREEGNSWVISYNGEIYNMKEIKRKLRQKGIDFITDTDTEVILKGYLCWGKRILQELNGIFAFALWNEKEKELLLCRDRLGIKPLFYRKTEEEILFASEIKAILPKEGVGVNKEGLCELLALGPARTPGKTVYQEIKEIKPGTLCLIKEGRMEEEVYWKLVGREHEEGEKKTVEKTSYLVEDAIRMQMLSDIPVCTFLSGGLDSSIVSAVAAAKMREERGTLSTFSFDFSGNDTHFQANGFQPSQDAPFAREMAEYLGTKHEVLVCNNRNMFLLLENTVKARDYPCMADIESSLYYFCSKVNRKFKVALTGECADEIFGGYPWFYKKEMFEQESFPWSYDMGARTSLLKEELVEQLKLNEYAQKAYFDTLKEVPVFHGDSKEEARRRELMYLNLRWFMATLLERMDRTSMANGLEARVPFADHRIVEYLYNVPWKMKFMGGREKGLLREASRQWLPDSVLYRKKSPYPKTYDPGYEKLLIRAFGKILEDREEPLHGLIDEKKVKRFLEEPLSKAKPWYGQLMAGPQLLAYYLQINLWMKEYKIKIEM